MTSNANQALDQAQVILTSAVQHHQSGNLKQAEILYRQLLELIPGEPGIVNNLAVAIRDQGRKGEALALLKDCAQKTPGYADTYYNIGLIHEYQNEQESAAEAFGKACEKSQSHMPRYRLALALLKLKRHEEAAKYLRETISLQPDHVEAHVNLSIALFCLENFAEAEEFCKKAIAMKPDYMAAHLNLAAMYKNLFDIEKAIAAYEKLLSLHPNNQIAESGLLYCYQHACDFEKREKLKNKVLADTDSALREGKTPAISPFEFITISADPKQSLAVARAASARYAEQARSIQNNFGFSGRKNKGGKIVIGYLSADMRDHAFGYNVRYLFAAHDRGKFVINAYSTGRNDNGECRKKISDDCDNFFDCAKMSDLDIARKIHADGVDILVDMTCHTNGGRMLVCAQRPAPVQVAMLGFTCTTGADFIDYIIADKIVVPPEHRDYYSEKCAYLPRSLEVNHGHEKISQEKLTRKDFGMPENAFVFNVSHQAYKIDPEIFGTWMGILKKIPESVMCFRHCCDLADKNLLARAKAAGIAEERLIFLKKLPAREMYFKRLSLMDLGLDTLTYNGGSTTMDSLWAGVPVISVLGTHYASRMAAGIINGVGMFGDLVVKNLEEYENLAINLATNPKKLSELRDVLWKNRTGTNLFNSESYAGYLEKIYEKMWDNYRAGKKPEVIEIYE